MFVRFSTTQVQERLPEKVNVTVHVYLLNMAWTYSAVCNSFTGIYMYIQHVHVVVVVVSRLCAIIFLRLLKHACIKLESALTMANTYMYLCVHVIT